MPDESIPDTSTAISPDEAARLWAKHAPSAGTSKAIGANEAAKLWASKSSGAKSLPGGFSYDPAMVEKYEGGGLKQPTVDPIDLATFGIAGLGEGAAKEAIEKGISTYAPEALAAGGREAAKVGLGFIASPLAQKLVAPAVSALERRGPVGEVTGGLIDQAAGLAPSVAPELGVRGLRNIAGAKDIAKTATEAADESTEAAEQERTKLEGAAAKERLGQKTASATAAEQTGQANLAARQKLAQEAQAKIGAFQTTHTAAMADWQKGLEEKKQQIAKELTPEARVASIQQGTGGPTSTPSSLEQGPERIARDAQFQQTVKGPLERWRADWAVRRNTQLAPIAGNKVDDAPLREAIAAERQRWEPTHAPYSPRVSAFLDELSAGGKLTDDQLLARAGYAPDAREQIIASAAGQQGPRAQVLKEGDVQSTIANRGAASRPNMAQKLLSDLRTKAEGEGAEQPTIGDLIGKQSEASKLARASKGADRTAMQVAMRGIDDTLASVEAPTGKLKALNAEYANHRTNFPYAFEDAITKAPRPVDAAPLIFDHPQRALDLIKSANPDERANLGSLYADWVQNEGPKAIKPEHSAFLSKLYPGTPLAKPQAWIVEPKAVASFQQLLDTSPAVKQKAEQALTEARGELRIKYGRQIAKEGFADAAKLGPAGQRIIAAMRATNDPAEQAKVALQAFSGLTPEAAAKELGQTQIPPGAAAGGAAMMAPRTARTALENFQPPSSDDAAIRAIQQYKGAQGGFAARWRRRAEFYLPLELGTMAIGHPSTYAGAALALGGPILAGEGIAKIYRQSLTSPEAAGAFYRAITNPGAPGALKTLMRIGVEANLAPMIATFGHPAVASPTAPAPAPQRKGPGPLARAIEDKRAQTIAGARGANSPSRIDRIAELDKGVAGGDTPNVTDDLKAGRLSTGEVRKIVEGHKPSVMAMFDGLSIPDSIEAFAGATREEQEAALPALANKINQEGKGMQPAQRQDMLAQLKKAMQPDQMAG